jgi:hypothetical protein
VTASVSYRSGPSSSPHCLSSSLCRFPGERPSSFPQPSKAAVKADAGNSQFGDKSQQVPFSQRPTRLNEVQVCRQKPQCRNLHPSKRMRLSTIAAACPQSGTALERSRHSGFSRGFVRKSQTH